MSLWLNQCGDGESERESFHIEWTIDAAGDVTITGDGIWCESVQWILVSNEMRRGWWNVTVEQSGHSLGSYEFAWQLRSGSKTFATHPPTCSDTSFSTTSEAQFGNGFGGFPAGLWPGPIEYTVLVNQGSACEYIALVFARSSLHIPALAEGETCTFTFDGTFLACPDCSEPI